MTNIKNQSELNFSCDAGSARVNVFTGRLLFERPDIVVGANSFHFGVSHVYDSQRNATLPHPTLMGQGWNLNIQQYLVPNTNVQSATSFVYHDGSGHSHSFVAYDNNSRPNHFYDTTGLGLTLIRTTTATVINSGITGREFSSNLQIVDMQGGRLIFDTTNRLRQIVSAQNTAIIKEIVYNGNRITEVFDTRNQDTRKVRLFYETINGNELLTRMDCIQNNIPQYEVRYRYDGQNLSSILDVDVPQGKKRIVVVYRYDSQNRLTHAVRKKSGSALRFSYCEESATNQIEKVETGTMSQPAVFVSSSTIVGTVTTGGTNQFTERSHSSFTYNLVSGRRNSTTVTNERNIAIDYFFNSKGFTTGVLERRDPNNPNDLMTLTKDSARHYVPIGTNSSMQINTRWSHTVPYTEGLSFPVNEINAFIRDGGMRSDNSNLITRYVVSFWLRTTESLGSDFRTAINLNFNEPDNWINEVYLDGTAPHAWQYVTIPVHLRVNDTINIHQMFLQFWGRGTASVEVANIRIAPMQSPEMWIGTGNEINDSTNLPLLSAHWRSLKGIRYRQNQTWTGVPVDSNFFLCESDISATYLNIANSGGNHNAFDLVYCNGTKRLRVNEVQLSQTAQSGSSSSGTVISLRINPHDADNEANFQIRNISSDENSRSISQHWYSSTNLAQKTYTHTREDGGSWIPRGDEYITVNRQGSLLNERDSYGVTTTYNYDTANFGTLESVVVSHSDTTETLTHSFAYNNHSTPRDREHLTGHVANGVTQNTTFNSPFATLNTTQTGAGAQSSFVRGIFSRLDEVNQANATAANSRNTIAYNAQERISRLSERNGHDFTFQYNEFGDVTSYGEEFGTNGRNTILTKTYNNRTNVSLNSFQIGSYNDNDLSGINLHLNNAAEVRETFSNLDHNSVIATFDNYGKPRRVRVGLNNTDITYQNNAQFGRLVWGGESPSTAQVSRITDRHENRSTVYHFDDENRPCRYEVVNTVGDVNSDNVTRHLGVIQSAPNRTQYQMDGERVETEIVYDDTAGRGGTSPRIMGTRFWTAINPNHSPINEERDFSINYGYDNLGRLRTRNGEREFVNTNQGGHSIFTDRQITSTNNYRGGTNLINNTVINYRDIRRHAAGTVQTNINRNTRNTTSYRYDTRNNVDRITENVLVTDHGATTMNNTHTRNFTYDAQDRIETETLQNPNGTLDTNRRYEYAEGNRVSSILNNTTNAVQREFTYDNSAHGIDSGRGRLRRVSGETADRTYDNFGNLQGTNSGTNWQSFVWYRGNQLGQMLSGGELGTSRVNYTHNYQGVRFRKVIDGVTTEYYLDGSKILGENRGNVRLRYIYDATGLAGVRRRTGAGVLWENFTYQKDALGNITGIVNSFKEVVCRYFYTAFGETSIRNASGTVTSFEESHIAMQNPFRWKSHYWDAEMGFYYIDGRYYDPMICGYISAESPENLLFNASEVHGLNRYGITTTNAVVLMAALYAIFTSTELSWDTSYERQFSAWNRFMLWLGRASPWIRWSIVAVAVIVFIVAAVASKGTLIIPMLKAAVMGAISGFVIAGIMSAVGGAESIGEVLTDAAWGALTGAAMSVAMVGAIGSVKVIKAHVANKKIVNAVIQETLAGARESAFALTKQQAEMAGRKFVGKGFTKHTGKGGGDVFVKKTGDQVFRFRMDATSVAGKHWPNYSHFHLEIFNHNTLPENLLVNNHIRLF